VREVVEDERACAERIAQPARAIFGDKKSVDCPPFFRCARRAPRPFTVKVAQRSVRKLRCDVPSTRGSLDRVSFIRETIPS